MSGELNPYDVLGVKKTATERVIRDAYRKLSKVHHPDAGGKTEQFAALVAAHQILTDTPRRAWYDEHGFDRGPEEQIRTRAFSTLSAHVQAILMADEEPRGNLVEAMRKVLNDQLQKQRNEGRANHDKVLKRLAKLQGKFKAKRGKVDEFASILSGHKREVEMSLRNLQSTILVNETALRILDDYTFEEETLWVQPGLRSWNQSRQHSSASSTSSMGY